MKTRPLFCPICGARVEVQVDDATLPESHEIPDHAPAIDVNLCQCLAVRVIIDWIHCRQCGCKMAKHPGGVCLACFKTGPRHD